MKILVVRLDHLGDILLTTPLVRALASAGHSVEMLAPAFARTVLEHNPHLRALHAVEVVAPDYPRRWGALARWIRRGRFDCLVLPFARDKALLLASFFSGVRRRIAMWAGVWGRVTFHRCLRSRIREKPRHFADVVLDCARFLGAPPQGLEPEVHLAPEVREAVSAERALRFGSAPLVGIHPGCAGNTCNLPPAVYGEVARIVLARSEANVLVTGTAGESAIAAAWPAEILGSARLWNAIGAMDLATLTAWIGEMDAYLVPSTGPLHLASAQRIRTVSAICPRPVLSAGVWGNLGGPGTVLEPSLARCVRHEQECRRLCDFRGEISAEQIAEALLAEIRALGSRPPALR